MNVQNVLETLESKSTTIERLSFVNQNLQTISQACAQTGKSLDEIFADKRHLLPTEIAETLDQNIKKIRSNYAH